MRICVYRADQIPGDSLEHYGRLGMKWYQHIYGEVDGRARYTDKIRASESKKASKGYDRKIKQNDNLARIWRRQGYSTYADKKDDASMRLEKQKQKELDAISKQDFEGFMNEKSEAAKYTLKNLGGSTARGVLKNTWEDKPSDISDLKSKMRTGMTKAYVNNDPDNKWNLRDFKGDEEEYSYFMDHNSKAFLNRSAEHQKNRNTPEDKSLNHGPMKIAAGNTVYFDTSRTNNTKVLPGFSIVDRKPSERGTSKAMKVKQDIKIASFKDTVDIFTKLADDELRDYSKNQKTFSQNTARMNLLEELKHCVADWNGTPSKPSGEATYNGIMTFIQDVQRSDKYDYKKVIDAFQKKGYNAIFYYDNGYAPEDASIVLLDDKKRK